MTPSHAAHRPRIALIHATRVAIDPIEAAASTLWPEAETVTILEEGLSIDRLRHGALSADLHARILGLARYAAALGSDGILFTCTAFGAAIEAAAREAAVPVLKPNEAMFAEALWTGERIAMITTFPPAAAGMEREFHEAAAVLRPAATLRSVFCDGALDALRRGDAAAHDRLIAQTVAALDGVDVVMLGQFSMAGAQASAQAQTDIPVLSSPDSAIRAIRARIIDRAEA